MSPDDADELSRWLVVNHPLVWWEGHGYISTKDNLDACLRVANILQQRVVEVLEYCLEHNLPCRIVVLKPRQKGISTITTAILYWMLHRFRMKALLVGGKDKQWQNLLQMVKRYHGNDTFEWGFGGAVGAEGGVWDNGSILQTETAGGKDPGRSGTFQVMLLTEIGSWAREGVRSGKSVITALNACVDFRPKTIVIAESTSSGAAGVFKEDLWDMAVEFEDFKRGIRKPGGWVRVFAGAFEFGDEDPLDPGETAADVLSGIGARNDEEKRREAEYIRTLKLTAGQVKYWRRLLMECANDPEKRDMEYPPTPDDAFRAASECRFNMGGLKRLLDEALLASTTTLQCGMLDQPSAQRDVYVWRKTQTVDEANFWLNELPITGCRYSISIDNAGGRATETDQRDTDHHAVTVLRDGYFRDAGGGRQQWMPPAVVATTKEEQRVDIDILADWVYRLYCFYGRPLVIPEANNDRGLILLLRKKNVRIYEQTQPATKKEAAKPSGKLGFWTRGSEGEGTRRWIIEDMARRIREVATTGDGVFIPFPWIVRQLMAFRTNPETGKDEAMAGYHDDWVLALAIGLNTMGGGTIYHPQLVAVEDPPDLKWGQSKGAPAGTHRV